MKCIWPDLITSVAATSEASGYEAENVLDDSPTFPWRATGQTGTLTLTVSGGAEGLVVAGCNGATVTVTVKDGDGATVNTETFDLSGIDTWYKWFTQRATVLTGFGYNYTYQSGQHTIEIAVDTGSASIPAEIGAAKAGPLYKWREAVQLKCTLEDYSIDDRYATGGKYYQKRDIARSWSGSVLLAINPDFWAWIDDLARDIGKKPTGWWITDQAQQNWVIFAGFSVLPDADFSNRFAFSNFTLLEEV